MGQTSPLPWRERPLRLFPDADPRHWASLRKQALDLVLNIDLTDPRAVRELASILSRDLGHGARYHDHQWGQWQDDLLAIRRYALGQR